MILRKLVLASVLLPAVTGCAAPDCGEGLKRAPSYALDNPAPRASGTDLDLAGTAQSDIRIKRFEIAGVSVPGSNNYATWRVKIPADVLDVYRAGSRSKLPAKMIDACDTSHDLEVIDVISEAPLGTPAELLDVSLLLPEGECYMPADGSRNTQVLITAAPASAGVRVAITTSAGVLLGTRDSDHTVLLTDGGATSSARAFLRTALTGDAVASVTANAGTTFDYTDSFPVAVAPRFVGPGSAFNGKSLFVTVTTLGRLASCSASSTVSATSILSYGSGAATDILNREPVSISGPNCNQTALFEIKFSVGTTNGAVLRLTCKDTLGQQGSLLLTSLGDPVP